MKYVSFLIWIFIEVSKVPRASEVSLPFQFLVLLSVETIGFDRFKRAVKFVNAIKSMDFVDAVFTVSAVTGGI